MFTEGWGGGPSQSCKTGVMWRIGKKITHVTSAGIGGKRRKIKFGPKKMKGGAKASQAEKPIFAMC